MTTTRLRTDLLVSYLGQGWTALMSVAFIPFYIHYLGIESYGLIGLFVLLQSWMTMLDFGLVPILSREMARAGAKATSAATARTLLRGAELAVGCSSLLAAATICAGSDWLAKHWLRVSALPLDVVAFAISAMGFTAAVRSIEGLYRGAALGQGRQAFVNLLGSGMATLRGVGAVAVLAWVDPTVGAFFLWQLGISVVTCAVLAIEVYGELPVAEPVRKSLRSLAAFRGFAGGMLGITVLSLLLTQVDKLLLSRLLPLGEYGYYALASTIATALYLLVQPVTQTYYPRFCHWLATENSYMTVATYHQGAQLVVALTAPAALTLFAFPTQVIDLWTRNETLASHAGPLLRPLCLGTFCNALMWIPYQMQLAHGHTKTALSVNLVAVGLVVPSVLWITPRYGSMGAAWIWFALNASYVLVATHFMYPSFFRAQRNKWYRDDVVLPVLCAGAAVAAIYAVVPPGASRPVMAIALLASVILASLAAAMGAPDLRVALLNFRRQRAMQVRVETVVAVDPAGNAGAVDP